MRLPDTMPIAIASCKPVPRILCADYPALSIACSPIPARFRCGAESRRSQIAEMCIGRVVLAPSLCCARRPPALLTTTRFPVSSGRPDPHAPPPLTSWGSGDCSGNWHESDFYRWMHFSAPAPLQKPRRNRCALDLVRARGRHGPVILHLGHPGHRSWYPDSINACQCLNRGEKIPVPYMLEAQFCLLSRNSVENDREQ
jgi:hypothetical protein